MKGAYSLTAGGKSVCWATAEQAKLATTPKTRNNERDMGSTPKGLRDKVQTMSASFPFSEKRKKILNRSASPSAEPSRHFDESGTGCGCSPLIGIPRFLEMRMQGSSRLSLPSLFRSEFSGGLALDQFALTHSDLSRE